ncbi:MAG: YqjF family protein [Chitinophagales bacterium]
MSFLKAEWRKLAIANYIIDKDLLTKYIPAGTELDLWNGNCYVSLVGFMFVNTRLLGLRIPFHTNFEEVNLRFYVKRFENGVWKRGVAFIKEIVPKPALTFVANSVYNENYETLPMKHVWSTENGERITQYKWKKNNKWNFIKVKSSIEKFKIEANSETEFITEHYWGYARVKKYKSNEYEVTHPKWEVFEVSDYEIDIDFGNVYGQEFELLNSTNPSSVMLAEGSKITVENKRTIRTKQ